MTVPAMATEVTVAVAANFGIPAQKISALFSAASGVKVQLVPGSTGKLYAQVRNGAPFHVFLSADDETPSRMVREGLALAGSQSTYATGRLLLWSPRSGVVDGQGAVLRSDFRHLAIADPKLAPYGQAAIETLDALGLRAAVQGRLVQGESMGQAYQFVASGNADLGFVALSQVMVGGKISTGSAWLVPASWHTALKQDAVLLQAGKDLPAAQAFLNFLRTEPARQVMRSYGYEIQ
ncbi:molybdate ABC transporter substrate-binding protein [Rhodoferax sp.]|uniref:molybdate ABC transporter substrate-binding protein n=1 Tax=Rhodoferax sp. TaxID=50421 RepID=UPI0025D92145|nr:molybdate ABC transporter substrate-binding protein [Rhodoferax sp.]